ncbi:hypothetical protein NY412_13040, partial [Enterobacter hormaechei]|uniref:hypothetical protein n=1 Tax=Enterobacter hormaechei TaxID=158836 RepID=UPI0022F03790
EMKAKGGFLAAGAALTTPGYIIHEGHAGPIEAVAEDPLTVQVNAWLTWQFEFMLGPRERQEFRQKIIDLGIVGREEGMDLLAHAG